MTLQAITRFALVTADLPRLVAFYRDVLGFTLDGAERRIDAREMALLGLSGAGSRQTLTLGRQIVSIDRFEQAGRPYPPGSTAASLWFQHFALVVPDMDAAYARLREIAPISEGGPQQLPEASGRARAFKFRDPDGHPLELVQFPTGKAPATWRGAPQLPGQIGLGIDHSAISVADADASVSFYHGHGLEPGDRTLNHGPAQQRLDDLRDVEVAVVPLQPRHAPPHLELLGYRVPVSDRSPAPRPNDVAATRIVWRGDRAALLRDPDGHLQQIEP